MVPNHAYASVNVSRHVKVPKGDSTCNAKKVPVVPNHAYASVNVSRHVKVPVYPNAAYAVCMWHALLIYVYCCFRLCL